jgi:hypothetical protein
MTMCSKRPCVCSNPYCGYAFGVPEKYQAPMPAPARVPCTCGNTDDPQCKTGAHSDWCDGVRR